MTHLLVKGAWVLFFTPRKFQIMYGYDSSNKKYLPALKSAEGQIWTVLYNFRKIDEKC